MGRRAVPLDDVTKRKLEALKAAAPRDPEREPTLEDVRRLNEERKKRGLPPL